MNRTNSHAILIADLGYGDAGKGSIVDYLARITPAHTVVRYNGGAQAAHNVVTPDGRHHTFSQFGSGTFLPSVRTHLSRFMMVNPLAMLAEERHLQSQGIYDAFSRLSIERDALLTTPFQQSANRLREIARGNGRHGSCGMGVGETMSDWLTHGSQVLFAGDLTCRRTVVKKLHFMRDAKIAQLEDLLDDLASAEHARQDLQILCDPHIVDTTADVYQYISGLVSIVEPGYLGKILERPGAVIFEGAQGVLLDEWYGFYPYNTWSTLTFKNADVLLSENSFIGETLKLGLVRAYATRHGAGPFVTEDAGLSRQLPEAHNQNNPWQREFRIGYLDLTAIRYALSVIGNVDGLVVTNLDRMDAIAEWRVCEQYQSAEKYPNLGEYFDLEDDLIGSIKVPADPTDLIRQAQLTRLLMSMKPVYKDCERSRPDYLALISERLQLPIVITSAGPTALQKSTTLMISQSQELCAVS
jgi:adenylosuccinate synthase